MSILSYYRRPELGRNNLKRRLIVSDCPLLELPQTLLLKGGGASNTKSKDNCTFGLKRLELAFLREWDNIAFPEGVCPNLQELKLSDCMKLRHVGELCGLAKLQSLKITGSSGCANANLEELPSLESLISLEELQVWYCPKLKSIQGLAQLTRLQRVSVESCAELGELAGVEHVMSLNRLEVRCPKVQWDDAVVEQLAATPTIEGRLPLQKAQRKQLCAVSLYNGKVKVIIAMVNTKILFVSK